MNTKDQALKHLAEHLLITPGQDPNHSSLSLVLLNIALSGPGITAITAEALRAVAIILDAKLPVPPLTTTHLPIPDAAHLSDFENQIPCLKEVIQEIQDTTQINREAAEMITRAADIASNNLQITAQVINESVEELVTLSPQILAKLEEIPHQQASTIVTPAATYREALLADPSPPADDRQPLLKYPTSDYARGNAAIKERQLLVDIDPDHPSIREDTPRNAVITILQQALIPLEDDAAPSLKIRALTKLRNGGLVLELPSAEAVNWIKEPTRKVTFLKKLDGKARVKDRLFNMVVPFVPVLTDLTDLDILRKIEQENRFPAESVSAIKWIKDPACRSLKQRVAHVLLSLTSPQAANKLISTGLYLNHSKLCAHKDKKEPLRCLKCQRWGHFSKDCKEEKDTCGTCGGPHQEHLCNAYQTNYCINCKSTSHGSLDKGCPDYMKRLEELNAKIPENATPYFPTGEPWTHATLPPKQYAPIVQTRPPHPPQDTTHLPQTQQTLGKSSSGALTIQQRQPNTDTAPQDPKEHAPANPDKEKAPSYTYPFSLPPTPKIAAPLSPLRIHISPSPTPTPHNMQSEPPHSPKSL